MNEWLATVFLGLVEGVTEFLPISSTGHLLLAESLIGSSRSEFFNIGIQAGAILAVVFVYWEKLKEMALNWRQLETFHLIGKISLAFLLTAILGLASRKAGISLDDSNPRAIAWAFILGAGLIFTAEQSRWRGTSENVSWMAAAAIGIAQVIAGIFPGTSRSAATIMSAMLIGVNRSVATEFSFILGIPTMFAASGYSLLKEVHSNGMPDQWGQFTLGFVVSTLSAFVVVKWLIGFVRSHTFRGFAWYRLVLGIGILLWLGGFSLENAFSFAFFKH